MIVLGLNIPAAIKRIFILMSALCVLLFNQISIAGSGLFFNILATGTPANLSITLCLNGTGPLSCQNYTISALNLRINTTIPNHLYSVAGIKINTPGYNLVGCVPSSNGFCLFSVSNTVPANISVTKTVSQTTLTSSVSTLALSVKCPSATAGCVYTNPALTGNTRQITITNNGAVSATNLSVLSSGLPSGTTINASTCGTTLGANGSCIIIITPGKTSTSDCTTGIAPTNGIVTVRADNAIEIHVSVLVLSYSCIYQGGYIYSVDDTTTNTRSIGGKVTTQFSQATDSSPGIIWSSNSSGVYDGGVSLWGIDERSTFTSPSPNASPAVKYPGQANCNGATDGACNTNNIYVYYSTIALSTPPLSTYAVGLCKTTISGYSDWYLPAICELGPDTGTSTCTSPPLMQLEQNMVDSLPILLNNCIGPKCLANDYWSSTEQFGNPADTVWTECFASGGGSTQCVDSKSSLLGVRCARALTF
jgi:hypothetical protein